jgi:hypothetical protein
MPMTGAYQRCQGFWRAGTPKCSSSMLAHMASSGGGGGSRKAGAASRNRSSNR